MGFRTNCIWGLGVKWAAGRFYFPRFYSRIVLLCFYWHSACLRTVGFFVVLPLFFFFPLHLLSTGPGVLRLQRYARRTWRSETNRIGAMEIPGCLSLANSRLSSFNSHLRALAFLHYTGVQFCPPPPLSLDLSTSNGHVHLRQTSDDRCCCGWR